MIRILENVNDNIKNEGIFDFSKKKLKTKAVTADKIKVGDKILPTAGTWEYPGNYVIVQKIDINGPVYTFTCVLSDDNKKLKKQIKDRQFRFKYDYQGVDVVTENYENDRTYKKFKFKCSKCGNEFVDKYDYPLPIDCNACVRCPDCDGVSRLVSKEPLDENLIEIIAKNTIEL